MVTFATLTIRQRTAMALNYRNSSIKPRTSGLFETGAYSRQGVIQKSAFLRGPSSRRRLCLKMKQNFHPKNCQNWLYQENSLQKDLKHVLKYEVKAMLGTLGGEEITGLAIYDVLPESVILRSQSFRCNSNQDISSKFDKQTYDALVLPFSLMVSLMFAHNHGYSFVGGESLIMVSTDVQAGH